ncbi:MAG: ATP-binding protein [Pseudomonadota bacterium]
MSASAKTLPIVPQDEQLVANAKTIEVLIASIEAREAGGDHSGADTFGKALELDQMVEDRTIELQRTLLELQQTQAQLVHAQKLEAVGQLAAGVAHEINTPMQYIGDNTRFLEKTLGKLFDVLTPVEALAEAHRNGEDTSASVEALSTALKGAKLPFLRDRVPRALRHSIEGVETVSHIVAAMKRFSHPGSDDKEPTDLNHLIEVTKVVSRNEWKYVADVVLDLDPNVGHIPAFSSELGQVLLNLIVNAAHAIGDANPDSAEASGTITVSTKATPDYAVVTIEDDGCGIPEHVRNQVFNPFFTTKEVGRGTGQGLAIARDIVCEKHGGTIDLDSELGRGTKFIVKLPLHQEEAPQ